MTMMAFRNRRTSQRRDQRGQNLIEFALLTPFVILFVYAIVVFGLAMSTRSSLQQAVREAARHASVGVPLPTAAAMGAGNSPENLKASDVKWCFPNGAPFRAGDPIRAYADYPFELVPVGGIARALGFSSLSVTLSPKATARLEKDLASATPTASPCP